MTASFTESVVEQAGPRLARRREPRTDGTLDNANVPQLPSLSESDAADAEGFLIHEAAAGGS
jgi:hypothetical protein